MGLADKLAAASNRDRRRCDITIGDETFTVFSKPLTGGDIDRVMRRHPKFAEAPTIEAIVDILIAKAEDEDGEKAFTKADKPVLLRLPISVIHRMRGALFEDDEDLSDEAVDDEMGN